jgi:hypothetical protein
MKFTPVVMLMFVAVGATAAAAVQTFAWIKTATSSTTTK